jgi:predicted DNA-binding WGR domain protein
VEKWAKKKEEVNQEESNQEEVNQEEVGEQDGKGSRATPNIASRNCGGNEGADSTKVGAPMAVDLTAVASLEKLELAILRSENKHQLEIARLHQEVAEQSLTMSAIKQQLGTEVGAAMGSGEDYLPQPPPRESPPISDDILELGRNVLQIMSPSRSSQWADRKNYTRNFTDRIGHRRTRARSYSDDGLFSRRFTHRCASTAEDEAGLQRRSLDLSSALSDVLPGSGVVLSLRRELATTREERNEAHSRLTTMEQQLQQMRDWMTEVVGSEPGDIEVMHAYNAYNAPTAGDAQVGVEAKAAELAGAAELAVAAGSTTEVRDVDKEAACVAVDRGAVVGPLLPRRLFDPDSFTRTSDDWSHDCAAGAQVEVRETRVAGQEEVAVGVGGAEEAGDARLALHQRCPINGIIAGEFHCSLRQTNSVSNSNNFYIMQGVLGNDGKMYLYTHWGREGQNGQMACKPQADMASLERQYKKAFKSKTANKWEDRANFVPKAKKYSLVGRGAVENVENVAELLVESSGLAKIGVVGGSAEQTEVIVAAEGGGEEGDGEQGGPRAERVAAFGGAEATEVAAGGVQAITGGDAVDEREELLQAIELALRHEKDEPTDNGGNTNSSCGSAEANVSKQKRKKRKSGRRGGRLDELGMSDFGGGDLENSDIGSFDLSGSDIAVVSHGSKGRRRRRPVAEMLASAARSRLFYSATERGGGGGDGADGTLEASSANILILSSPLDDGDAEAAAAEAAAAAAAAAAVAGIAGITDLNSDDGKDGGNGSSACGSSISGMAAELAGVCVNPRSPNGRRHADSWEGLSICRGYDGSDVMIDGSTAGCARWGYRSGERIMHAETEMGGTVVGVSPALRDY